MTDAQDIPAGYCQCGCGAYTGFWPRNRPQRGQVKGEAKPFAQGHWLKPRSVAERLWEKVDKAGGPDACWPFDGARDPNGYGRLQTAGSEFSTDLAHRIAYELLTGPIPDGLTIDHLCRFTSCVNPAHLEAVSSGVNVLRGTAPSARAAQKTHCKRGHPLSGDNLKVEASGKRRCVACLRMKAKRRWAATKAGRNG